MRKFTINPENQQYVTLETTAGKQPEKENTRKPKPTETSPVSGKILHRRTSRVHSI